MLEIVRMNKNEWVWSDRLGWAEREIGGKRTISFNGGNWDLFSADQFVVVTTPVYEVCAIHNEIAEHSEWNAIYDTAEAAISDALGRLSGNGSFAITQWEDGASTIPILIVGHKVYDERGIQDAKVESSDVPGTYEGPDTDP